MNTRALATSALLAMACSSAPKPVAPPPEPETEPIVIRPEPPPPPPPRGWDPEDTASLPGRVVVRHSSSLTALAVLLDAAQLDDELWAQGPITLLAPTDAAFAAMDVERLEALRDPANGEALRAFLSAHVLRGRISAAQLAQDRLKTIDDTPLDIGSDQRGVTLHGAHLLRVDIPTLDATIHIIDRALVALPPAPEPPPAP
jgi:uncharacterized surface protein with fasciclin (FAS1) repeats